MCIARARALRWSCVTGMALLLGCAVTAAAAPPAGFPDSRTGQQLVLQKGCANCHGILGPSGREGPDLFRVARGRGAADLLADMWNHVPHMSSALLAGERLPRLSATELRDLVGYLNFVNYLGDVGDARRGESLLADMSCLGCHDLRAKDRIGPALFVSGRTASPVGLVTDLWNHYPGMNRALHARNLRWFHWTGDVITDLSGYLRSLAPTGAPAALQDPGDPREGARLFARLGCVGCHDPTHGSTWVEFVRTANRRSAAENGAALLGHVATLGGGARRPTQPLRPLSEKNMADLLAYLGFAGADLPGGDAARGHELFESKRCVACHALPGARPGIGPDVATMPAIADPYEAAALMFEHARNMKTATELKHVPWPQMQPEELQDLYAFLCLERRR
jgi:cytochrome c2